MNIIKIMRQYHDLLKWVLSKGKLRKDRTGVGTYSVFGAQSRYDIAEGFPLLSTKKVHFKSVVHELLWFLKGESNLKYLHDNKVRIWDEWADENGDLGRVYGVQWTAWRKPDGGSINQIERIIEQIKSDPTSRRHIVSAWNVGELDQMALLPCHAFFQFYVDTDERTLSCHLYQRSADLFLGVPFNIASYSLLTMMIAQLCDLKPGEFIHSFGDLHIYTNHVEQVELQLARDFRPLPEVMLNSAIKNIRDFKFEDIELHNYNPHPLIKAPIAV